MSQTVLHSSGLRWVRRESVRGPASCVLTSLRRAVFSAASKGRRLPVGLPSPAMGHEGAAGGWRYTQRPTGATVMVLVSLSVFLFGSAGYASASHHHICPTDMNSIKLSTYQTAYITNPLGSVSLRVEVEGCVNVTRVFDLSDLKVSNQTSQVKDLQWYEFTYINCGNYVVKIGSKVFKLRYSSHKCIHKPITLSVGYRTRLGKKCPQIRRMRDEMQMGKAACRALSQAEEKIMSIFTKSRGDSTDMGIWGLLKKDKPFDTSDLFSNPSQDDDKTLFNPPDLFINGQQEPIVVPNVSREYTDLLKPETFNFEDFFPVTSPPVPSNNLNTDFFDNDTFSKGRSYKENSIPIFIGIVAFTVSMCLRFCLCHGKSVVRRVTTVTVIRSRPVDSSDVPQDQQDEPPAYVDVVNENNFPDSPTDDTCSELPPPAYADIAHEVLPPTYSEVEAQSISPAEASLTDLEGATQTSSPPPDPGPDPDDKGSETSKGVLSKYRSQKKQFAFKVLEEDE